MKSDRIEKRVTLRAPVARVWGHLLARGLILASEPAIAPMAPETPEPAAQTGAFFLADDEAIEPELEAFLAAGPPPVYVGFGSMVDRDPARTTRLVVDAVAAAGLRALISRGWAGLGEGGAAAALPAEVRAIGPAPHGRLHLLDQFYWADRLWRLGLTPRPIPRTRLTPAALALALRAATTDAARRRASTFAAGMIQDGVARAVEVIASLGPGEPPARPGGRR